MRILALETSSLDSSIALLEGATLRVTCQLPSQARLTETLLPTIADQLRTLDWQPADLQLVAVTLGPGSFTGLRVGVMAAKSLAYALRIPVIGVDTLDVLAWQAYHGLPSPTAPPQPLPQPLPHDLPPHTHLEHGPPHTDTQTAAPASPSDWIRASLDGTLHVLLDAQRKELFQATFRYAPGESPSGSPPMPIRQAPTRIVPRRAWLEEIALAQIPGTQPPTVATWDTGATWVTGTGLKPLQAQIPAHVQLVDPRLWVPQASVVGLLARQAYEAGRRNDFWTLAPNYLRQSAAEEKAAASDGVS